MVQEEVVLLRVQLDEGKTTDRMKQLAVELAKTRAEQKELTQAYNQGLLSEEAYGQKSVELGRQLRAQQQEQTALTKNLELWDKATKGVADSYQAQQAQLSLAQQQYQQLAGSANNSTEETKALSGVINELRGTLKTTDAGMGLFVRNVGNYSGAVEPLIAELKRLEVQQQGMAQDSPAYQQQQQRIVGFQQAINQAGAEAGLTYEQTQAKLKSYGDAIAPVVGELVKLENEQASVAEGSEAYARIGFQMQKLKKDVEQTTAATEDNSSSIAGAVEQSGLFGDTIGQLSAAKEKYTAAVNLAKAATAGEVTVLNLLKFALIATGIGAFVVILGSLIAFLTKTQAGTEFLSRKMAALGAVFSVLTNVVTDFGGKIFAAFENPKQALSDLVDFIGNNLLNRLKAVGVVLEGLINLDVRKIGDGIIQAGTGIENATGKAQAFTQVLGNAAAEGERLAALQRELDRATDDNIDTNKRLLNEVERLKNIRDNEFNSLAVRKKANEDAFKVEMQRENTLASLAQRRVEILSRQIQLEGGRDKVSRERYQELKEAENELSDIREDAAGKQNELITNRYQLDKEGQDKAKERADKAAAEAKERAEKELAAKQNALRVQLGYLDIELQETRKGSEEELNVLRRKLDTQRKLELTAKDLTVGQRGLIERKYYADSLKLEQDHQRELAGLAFDAALAATQVRLTTTREGSDEEANLRAQAIEQQLQKELAAIDTRASAQERASREAVLRANAEKATAEVDYEAAARKLENFLAAKRQFVERDYATGKLSEEQYQQAVYATEQAAVTARTALATDYHKNTDALSKQSADLEISEQKRITDKTREQTQQRIQLAQELGGQVGELLGKSLTEQGATLEGFFSQFVLLLLDVLEKQALVATAQATIGSLASPESIATAGVAGLVKAAVLTAAIKAAFAVVKAAVGSGGGNGPKFAEGGVLQGPSHAQGGVQLYSRSGYHFGEAEGGEPILTAAVSRNRTLLAAASAINVAAGGRPLVPSAHMALGGVTTSALVRESIRGGLPGFDYSALAEATAEALRKSPPITRWVDAKDAAGRAAFTDTMSNS